jgi:transposase
MTNYLSRSEKRSLTNQFKKQMVMLCQNGKKRTDIVAEYDLTQSALDRGMKSYKPIKKTKRRKLPKTGICFTF